MPKDTHRSRSISLRGILESPRRRRRAAWRPQLEPLEGRALLATFSVTSLANSGTGTLLEAISNANDETNHPGPDTIQFDSTLAGGTIDLTSFRNDPTGI